MNYKTELNRLKDPLLDELYPQVTTFVEERLAKLNEKDAQHSAASLERVMLSLSCSKKGLLVLNLELWFYFGGILGVKRGTSTVRLKYENEASLREKLPERCRQIVLSLCSQLMTGFPVNPASNIKFFNLVSVDASSNSQYASFWRSHPSFAAHWKEFWKSRKSEYSESLQKKIVKHIDSHTAEFTGQAHCSPMRLKGCSVEVSLNSLKAMAKLSIDVSYGSQKRIWKTSISRNKELTLQEVAAGVEYVNNLLWKWLTDFAKDAPQEILQNAAFCVAELSDDGNKKIRGLLERISRPSNLVQGDIKGLHEALNFTDVKLDGAPGLIKGNPLTVLQVFDLDYSGYLLEQKRPYTLRRKELPNNIHTFAAFLDLANTLYQKMPARKLKEKPVVLFTLAADKSINFTCRRKNTSIKTFQKAANIDEGATVHSLLTAVFEYILAQESELEEQIGDAVSQLDALRLSPIEVAILRYLRQQGKSWYTDIAENANVVPRLSKAAIGRRLDGLLNKAILVNGKTTPLIWFEWISSRKHEDYRMYHPADFLTDDVLDQVNPRPFGAEDMPDMEKDSRENWFRGLAKAASYKETLWTALQVLEHMPASFAAAYVRSNEGRDFLSRLQDNDALYAKFFVESLPGCKRLADQIFENTKETERC